VSNTDDPDKPSPPPPDPGATVILTPEEVERLRTASAAARTAPTGEDPLIGTLIRDKWRVLERLGAGSFGTVYKVQDVTGGWIEALKILGVDRLTGAEADQMRARFLREAQIMKRLGKDSRHIVGLSTYEEDFESGLVYFLMEFVEGRSLGDALGAEGPFPPDRVVRLAAQVCEALIVAHEGPEPVVHRDLKLENLMLTRAGAGEEIVKVLDFGIAKIAERDADSRLTTVGTGRPGTPPRSSCGPSRSMRARTSSRSGSSSTPSSPDGTPGSATWRTSRRPRSTSSWSPPIGPRSARWWPPPRFLRRSPRW
jgi:serine/threonine protein kinase